MDKKTFNEVANKILNQVGLGPAAGDFSPKVAWAAHKLANARKNAATMLRKLLDIEEHFGPGTAQEAVVQTVLHGGSIRLESYPMTLGVWETLGFEVYQNGDGSHGAHIPASLRDATPSQR